MNIEEAIKHAEEMANIGDCDCANEHRQLAAWLRELMMLRKVAEAARAFEDALANCGTNPNNPWVRLKDVLQKLEGSGGR